MDILEVAESLTRDKRLLALPGISLRGKLELLARKYGFRAAARLGVQPSRTFRFNGRLFEGDSYADPGFLALHLGEMQDALTKLGLAQRSGLNMVDVGAHHGETALAWSLLCDKPRIASFEPDPGCYRRAVSNTRGLPVTLHNIGLGNQSGLAPFDLRDRFSLRRTFVFPGSDLEGNGAPLARIARGDDLIDFPVVDLLKIDVEGFEYEVLLGFRETLKRCRNMILELSLERPHTHHFRSLAGLLSGYAFELVSAGAPWREGPRVTGIDLYFHRA